MLGVSEAEAMKLANSLFLELGMHPLQCGKPLVTQFAGIQGEAAVFMRNISS